VRLFFQPVGNAGDSVLAERHMKVEEQAKALVCQAKIRQKPLLVNRCENLDGLDLHLHFVDDQIGPEPGVDPDVLGDDRDRLLALTRRQRAMQT